LSRGHKYTAKYLQYSSVDIESLNQGYLVPTT